MLTNPKSNQQLHLPYLDKSIPVSEEDSQIDLLPRQTMMTRQTLKSKVSKKDKSY